MFIMKSLTKFKFIAGFLLITGYSLSGYGQKLKSVQVESVWAPANIKVDGKLNEWDDTFHAYNPATSLNYTLSNDANNLYLTIKSEDQANNNKIAGGGLDITINTEDKKKEKDAFELTYPMPNKDLIANLMQRRGGRGGGGGGGGRPFTIDSTTLAMIHKKTIEGATDIALAGFKNISDSVVSIYNLYGIKAGIAFNAKGDLTYELAIPLKLLGLSADNPKEFYYNIRIDAVQFSNNNDRNQGNNRGGGFGGPPGGGFGGGGGGRGGGFNGPPGGGGYNPFEALLAPTDFWGKYTLAKGK